MKEPLSERREFVRIAFNAAVEIRTPDGMIRTDAGFDVSLNGLRVPADGRTPAEGTPCTVRILLKASRQELPIEARGTVVRSGPGSVAVQFTELDLDSYQHLRQLILCNTGEPEKAEQEFLSHWGIRPSKRPPKD